MTDKLDSKIALVTGASSGLGKAVAEKLNGEGMKVIALARSAGKANLPDSIQKISMNIRDLDSIDNAFGEIDKLTDHIGHTDKLCRSRLG